MQNLQAIIRKSVNNVTNQWDRLGYVANDLANFNTHGYKSVRFEQMLGEDGYLTGAIRTDHKNGSIQITSNPYDVALTGPGFIPVVSPQGEVQYTRDGAFKQGCYKFIIKPNGDVIAHDAVDSPGKKIGNIPVVQFDNPEGLEQGGLNKLVATEDSGEPRLIKNHEYIAQNNIENSNVNIYDNVNVMLRLNASMLASTRLMKVVDDMYNKSINIRE